MRINNTPQNSPNFGALHIADVHCQLKDKNFPLKIYNLKYDDISFVTALRKKTNFRELMPNLDERQRNVWQQIFTIATHQTLESTKSNFLVTYKDKPCGIMAFTKTPFKYFVDTICTWPTEPEKRVPLAGKTLFNIFFKDFLKTDAMLIDIDAVTNGPFHAVTKYMELGFKQRGGENGVLSLSAKRDAVETTSKNLDKFIKISPLEEPIEVDLNKTIF